MGTSETKTRAPAHLPLLGDRPTLTFVIATVNGSFWAILASQPLDVVKSRLQNMVVPTSGTPPYSGALDCAAKCMRESPLVLMRGFFPSFLKFSPYQVLAMTLAEKITLYATGKAAF